MPAYRAPERHSAQRVARLIAEGVSILAERLHRLPRAYPHWQRFDPAAYFDLHPQQTQALLRIETLGATLDVTLYADMLSPAFRRAERFWAREFCPAYFAAGLQDAFDTHFWQRTLPAMQRRLQEARAEITLTGNLLFEQGNASFLAATAAHDERAHHHHRLPDDKEILDLYNDLPTLTLRRSYDILEMMQAAAPTHKKVTSP